MSTTSPQPLTISAGRARHVAVLVRWGSSLLSTVTRDLSRGVSLGDPTTTSEPVDVTLPEALTGTSFCWLVRARAGEAVITPPPSAQVTRDDAGVELSFGEVRVNVGLVEPLPSMVRLDGRLFAALIASTLAQGGLLAGAEKVVRDGGLSLVATEDREHALLARSILLRIEAQEWSDQVSDDSFERYLTGRWVGGMGRRPTSLMQAPLPPDQPPRAAPRSLAPGTVGMARGAPGEAPTEPILPPGPATEGYVRCLEAALLRDFRAGGTVVLSRVGAGAVRALLTSTAPPGLRDCALRVAQRTPQVTFGTANQVTLTFTSFHAPGR